MSLWGADFHIVFKLRFLFLLFDDLHRFFVRCILTCRKETILINSQITLNEQVSCTPLLLMSPAFGIFRCLLRRYLHEGATGLSLGDAMHLTRLITINICCRRWFACFNALSKWIKPRTASSQRPWEFAVLDAWCWELSNEWIGVSAQCRTQCGQIMLSAKPILLLYWVTAISIHPMIQMLRQCDTDFHTKQLCKP